MTRLFQFPMLPQMILGWLVYLVLVALALAAFLHWRRIKRLFLLILGMAPLCLLLGLLMVRLGEMPLRGATLEQIASGARHATQSLITVGAWLSMIGVACAGVGAAAAIRDALKRPGLPDNARRNG